ncbi:MAG: VCBS repeat-containing protein, partial [Pyrinomonadaceae bacterium]|nr:VCBS repeat-containing protein [Pyrinomonadaceae bacterium]
VTFGISTDKPAQGDYDGDGKADQAVFRPSNGTWYLLQSTDGFTTFNFGIDGDVPSTGDYDGDGKADAAVFRPSNGVWYLRQSTAGIYSQQFGIATDRSVPNAYLAQ